MKLFDYNLKSGAEHIGCRGWLGHNPNIQIATPGIGEDVDFAFYHAWGDGAELQNDVNTLRSLAVNPVIYVITGDNCYVPDEDDGNFYFVTHLNPKFTGFQMQVPYSYHASLEWYSKNLQGVGIASKTLLANFLGSFKTNPKRENLAKIRNKHISVTERDGWELANSGDATVLQNALEEHSLLLESSFFTLCPRGKGPSSIRVVEAIFRNSIPVMLDDDSKLFGDHMEFAIRFPLDGDLEELVGALMSLTKEPDTMNALYYAMGRFKRYFLLSDDRNGCKSTIGYTEIIRKAVMG